MAESDTRPRIDIADTIAGVDAAWDEWDDDVPAHAPPSHRRRLFAVLGWAAGGFAALTALSFALTGFVSGIAIVGGAIAAGIAVAGFFAVFAMASRLHGRASGHVLLWTTTLAYAVVINVFSASFGFDALITMAAVAGTASAALAILALGVAIGFGALAMLGRWVIFIGLSTGAAFVLAPEMWWVGLVAGFLLAIVVEMTLDVALQRPHVPEPALGACLIAGITAIVILVIFTLIRFGARVAAGAVAAGAEAARY